MDVKVSLVQGSFHCQRLSMCGVGVVSGACVMSRGAASVPHTD